MASDEVRNGAFVYRDALFAEVSEGKRHPRASAPELKDLLLPKKNSTPAKDQVAHWYEAQLIHYGLPRVKDKNAAKVRLLGAINSGNLVVPSHVQQLEVDLKKQYASAQRKAKNAAKKAESSEPVSAGKKRKASDMEGSHSSGTKTTMSFTVGDMTVNIDHTTGSSSSAAAKKSKTVSTTAKKAVTTKASAKEQISKASPTKITKTKPAKTAKPSAAKPKVKSVASTKQIAQDSANSGAGIGNHVRKPQTARRSRPFNHSAGRPAPPRDPTPMSLCTDDEEPPPPYAEYESDDVEDGNSTSSEDQHVTQISGAYAISTSSARSAELIVRISHIRDQLWGRFTIGPKTGIIRLDNINDIASSAGKSFGWRSEDCDTDQLRFGKGCDGWIEFDGGGGVQGAFHGLFGGADTEFKGGLEEDFGHEVEQDKEEIVGSWASGWHEYPERAYGRR